MTKCAFDVTRFGLIIKASSFFLFFVVQNRWCTGLILKSEFIWLSTNSFWNTNFSSQAQIWIYTSRISKSNIKLGYTKQRIILYVREKNNKREICKRLVIHSLIKNKKRTKVKRDIRNAKPNHISFNVTFAFLFAVFSFFAEFYNCILITAFAWVLFSFLLALFLS